MSWSSVAAGALAVVASLLPTRSPAQGIRPQLGFALARSIPTGEFHAAARDQGFESGWQGIALVAISVPGWPVGLRLDGTYGTHRANDQLKADLTASVGQPADEKTKLLGANLDLTYPFGSVARAQPYLLGGIGVYDITISVTSGGSTVDKSETKFAWNLGGGILYRVGSAALFVEGRYVDVAAVSGFPGVTFFPVTVGIRFGGP